MKEIAFNDLSLKGRRGRIRSVWQTGDRARRDILIRIDLLRWFLIFPHPEALRMGQTTPDAGVHRKYSSNAGTNINELKGQEYWCIAFIRLETHDIVISWWKSNLSLTSHMQEWVNLQECGTYGLGGTRSRIWYNMLFVIRLLFILCL